MEQDNWALITPVLIPLLGNLAGQTFMVVDQNGVPGYPVVQLENATHLGQMGLGNLL